MLLDPDRFNFPSQDVRRAQVKDVVKTACLDKVFTYTEALSLPQPLQSDVLEVLDGAGVAQNIPSYGNGDAETWDNEPVVLVCVHPPGKTEPVIDGQRTFTKDVSRIKTQVYEDQRIPGTNRTRRVKVPKDFGNAAKVPDSLPGRLARHILYRDGWPIVQNRTNGSRMGSVVEWRWLKKEVESGSATPDQMALYKEILTRDSFKKLGLPESEPTKTSTKSA